MGSDAELLFPNLAGWAVFCAALPGPADGGAGHPWYVVALRAVVLAYLANWVSGALIRRWIRRLEEQAVVRDAIRRLGGGPQ